MTDPWYTWEAQQAAGDRRADRVDEIMAEFRQDEDIGAIMRAFDSLTDRWNAIAGQLGGRFPRRLTAIEAAMEELLEAIGSVDFGDIADRHGDDE